MRFYTQQHRYTCGIDLHSRSLYVCILDDTGQKRVHKNVKASPEALLKLIADYQDRPDYPEDSRGRYTYYQFRGFPGGEMLIDTVPGILHHNQSQLLQSRAL